eukprot:scaffold660080_cov45-Prasinocladus_malaysianus.AAC.1
MTGSCVHTACRVVPGGHTLPDLGGEQCDVPDGQPSEPPGGPAGVVNHRGLPGLGAVGAGSHRPWDHLAGSPPVVHIQALPSRGLALGVP